MCSIAVGIRSSEPDAKRTLTVSLKSVFAGEPQTRCFYDRPTGPEPGRKTRWKQDSRRATAVRFSFRTGNRRPFGYPPIGLGKKRPAWLRAPRQPGPGEFRPGARHTSGPAAVGRTPRSGHRAELFPEDTRPRDPGRCEKRARSPAGRQPAAALPGNIGRRADD